MKIAICGASGFIGSSVVRALQHHGITIYLVSGEWIARHIGANNGLLPPAVRDHLLNELSGAEVVINCSGKARASVISRFFQNQNLDIANVKVPAALAEIADGIQARGYIHLSTLAVYSQDSPITLGEPENPTSAYARSKLSGERLVTQVLRKSSVACLIVRFPLMIDKDVNPVIWLIQKWLKFGLPFPQFDGETPRSIITSGELSEFITRLLYVSDMGSRTYLLASEKNLTLSEIVRSVAERHKLRVRFFRMPSKVEKLLIGCPFLSYKISRLVRGQVISRECLSGGKFDLV